MKLPAALSEEEALDEIRAIAKKNKIEKSFIGEGFYGTYLPTVILRNVYENPGWYTGYTPYQAEISQGRLEGLLNFQTMICDLTGLPIANSSLLDEATAAAEAYHIAHETCKRKKFFVSQDCHPSTIAVVRERAHLLGDEVVVGDVRTADFSTKEYSGVLVQYPNTYGELFDYKSVSDAIHAAGGLFITDADLLALTVVKAPGEINADVCVGSCQRFGLPMGFGGPAAGYMAVQNKHLRKMPGRIIGVTIDNHGNKCLRLALQAREQHIKRQRATSNVCTAQVLTANMSCMYAMYHGPEGLKKIATRVHKMANAFEISLKENGFNVKNADYFDTITVDVPNADEFLAQAHKKGILLRKVSDKAVSASFDETTSADDLIKLLSCFGIKADAKDLDARSCGEIPAAFKRTGAILPQSIFNTYHSEHQMTRYLHKLETKDLSLNYSMITLGSCTMKLNGTSTMIPITWPEFTNVHPYAPREDAKGYLKIIDDMDKMLATITGFEKMSFQPLSGAHGEFSGLLTIRKYLDSIGQSQRKICLIPRSAHGTNPASAAMNGMTVVEVNNLPNGAIDLPDLSKKIEQYKDTLACIMITYPSTYGIFDEGIKDIVKQVHDAGAQVYMDGANMNAQVGHTCPGVIGADVCHLNLHKTFTMPHGGGGPGVGAIGVAKHLVPFLPTNPTLPIHSGPGSVVSGAPYGSANLLPITWMYLRMLGIDGLRKVTACAILNANYMAARLSKDYHVMFRGKQGMCGHEFILDVKPFEKYGITENEIAKRMMDYGFHAPTMSFPVHGSLMIEPTESEDKQMLDRFCDALISIRKEIQDIADGKMDKEDNPLKNAPHTAAEVMSDKWNHKYSRELAAYPCPDARDNKYWPTCGKVDNTWGDRKLLFTVDSYHN